MPDLATSWELEGDDQELRLRRLEAFYRAFQDNRDLDNALRGPLRLSADDVIGLEMTTPIQRFIPDKWKTMVVGTPNFAPTGTWDIVYYESAAGTFGGPTIDTTNKYIYLSYTSSAAASAGLTIVLPSAQALTYVDQRPSFCMAVARVTSNTSTRNVMGFVLSSVTNLVTDPSDGIYFRCSSGNWFGVCRSGSAETTVDTGVGANVNVPKELLITMPTPGSVIFSINGIESTPITTNVPANTVLLSPMVYIGNGLTTTANITTRWAPWISTRSLSLGE